MQESAQLFCEGPDSRCFLALGGHGGAYSLCHNYLTLGQKKAGTTWNEWAWQDLAPSPSLLALTAFG